MFPSSLIQHENARSAQSYASKDTVQSYQDQAAKMAPVSMEQIDSMGIGELLDTLIHPRMIQQDGECWYQSVSRSPASFSDILRLEEKFNKCLLQREAREVGLCPIRSSIYEQCFLELIRQETLVLPERGRLLAMIHREQQLSLQTGLCCYESALAYGIKKKMWGLAETERMTEEVTNLLGRCADLDSDIQELEAELPRINEACLASEKEKQDLLEWEEKRQGKENGELIEQMFDSVEVTIDVESGQQS